MILAFLLVLFMAALGGCETLWIHPEATSDKYERDVYYCRFGVERLPADATPEEQRERAIAVQPREHWTECMYQLGWRRQTVSWGGRRYRRY